MPLADRDYHDRMATRYFRDAMTARDMHLEDLADYYCSKSLEHRVQAGWLDLIETLRRYG